MTVSSYRYDHARSFLIKKIWCLDRQAGELRGLDKQAEELQGTLQGGLETVVTSLFTSSPPNNSPRKISRPLEIPATAEYNYLGKL